MSRRLFQEDDDFGNMTLDEALQRCKAEFENPDPFIEKEPEMARKKTAEAPAAKKKAAKSAKSNGSAAKEGFVSLATVAKEFKMEPSAARRRLRAAELDRGDGRWSWKDGSKDLAKVRTILKGE